MPITALTTAPEGVYRVTRVQSDNHTDPNEPPFVALVQRVLAFAAVNEDGYVGVEPSPPPTSAATWRCPTTPRSCSG
jgi:hypothetical protein